MPQLNPTPWLLMMLITWLTINAMLTTINNTNPTNLPTTHSNQPTHTNPWIWPW